MGGQGCRRRLGPWVSGTCVSQPLVHQANCVQRGGRGRAPGEGMRHGFQAGTDPGPDPDLLLASVVSPFLRLQGDGYSDPRWLSGKFSLVWGDRVEGSLARCWFWLEEGLVGDPGY